LCMAAMDISKVFDSISHPAIIATLKNIGAPPPMVKYLIKIYIGSKTRLEDEDWTSAPFHLNRGVRQGNRLSLKIFNALTHRMLQLLQNEIGICLRETTINATADLSLRMISHYSLRHLWGSRSSLIWLRPIENCGINIDMAKSMTVSIIASPHLNKTVVDASLVFRCARRPLSALSRSSR